MDSLIGKVLSRYRIVDRLGAGGMGVVYRAYDDESGRDVALKVLPEGVLADSPSRRRFYREVLAVSQLSHPNIALVYDFDTQGDHVFLAMELLSGVTLDVALRRGPMASKDVIDLGIQLASALEAAHEHGVIHRDLKPNNIFLTESGVWKILDFGLSGYSSDESAQKGNPTPRVHKGGALTKVGQVMGTPGYMSPEQICAQEQDERTDVFSYGCVLYECFTGRRAFPGPSVDAIFSAILYKDPSWDALPAGVSDGVVALLRRCLEKEPHKRPSPIREIRIAFQAAQDVETAPVLAPLASPNNLPSASTPFVGRDRDIEECIRRLGESRCLTLIGPGGCGKTRLAVRTAEILMPKYPDGVWFLDLASLSDAGRVKKVLAMALGIRVESDLALDEALGDRLRGERALIIVDNCEHLLEASGELAKYLVKCGPGVSCLATSREPLGIPEEHAYVVPSMSVPRAVGDLSADAIAPYEAVRLFLDRARAATPGFHLSDENAPIVAEICSRLDGIPLAIELAAARVKSHTPAEIQSKLDDRFRLLTGDETASLPRHQTLQATIQWSDDLLLDTERRLLRVVSVFKGGWTLKVAAKVFGEEGHELKVLDLLNRLVSRSLAVLDRFPGGDHRYRLLESVREYSLERFIGSDLETRVRERHCNAFYLIANESERGLAGREQKAWLATLDLEHENILTAIDWCARPGGDLERGLEIAGKIWRFWYGRGHFNVGRGTLARLLAGSEGSRSEARARALRAAGVIAYYQADYVAARTWLTEGLALSRSFQDKLNSARGLNALAGVAMEEGKYDESRALNEESLALSREIGDIGGVGVSLGNLGILAKYQGDDNSARRFAEDAHSAFRESGDLGNVASTLFDLGATLVRMGESEEASRRLAECLALVSQLGEKRIGAYAIDAVGDLAFSLGDPRRAARLLGASHGIRRRIGAPLTPFEVTQRESAIGRVHASLPTEEFESAWDTGTRMSSEAAMEYAAETLEQSGSLERAEASWDGSTLGPVPADSTAILLKRMKDGDGRARDQLAERILPVLTRWAHGRLPQAARGMIDTDDLVQATMLRAFRRLDQFEPQGEGALLAFLRKALLNQIRDAARHAARRPGQSVISEDIVDREPSPLDHTMARGTFEAYEAALSQLSEGQRVAVILRLEMGYSYQHVADAVGAPSANAARMSITRGVRRIAELMKTRSR